MPTNFAPSASRSMLVTSSTASYPSDMTVPFSNVTYTAATRTITTTLTGYVFAVGDVLHIGASLTSLLQPGNYRVQSGSASAVVLEPNVRLAAITADVTGVYGYISPNAVSTVAKGATVSIANKQSSFMYDAQATIIDGVLVTASDSTAGAVTIYSATGNSATTTLMTIPTAASIAVGTIIPVPAANGEGFPGAFSAKVDGVSALNVRLMFRPATLDELAGMRGIVG